MVSGLRSERRRRTLIKWSFPAVAVVIVGLVVQPWVTPSGKGVFLAEIWCADVHSHAAAYVAGDLDAELQQQITNHIAQCQHCREVVESLQSPPAGAFHGSDARLQPIVASR